MRICFFGTYTLDEGYPVNRTILKALESAGVEVFQCRGELWTRTRQRWSAGRWFFSPFFWAHSITVYIKLIFKYFRGGPYDLLVVGYLGHQDIFLARLLDFSTRRLKLGRRRPVVLIAFNSLYETLVQDRRLFSSRRPLSWLLRWLDRTACQLADRVILDTQAHIDYFVREFTLPPSKFLRVFVGSDFSAQPPHEPSGQQKPSGKQGPDGKQEPDGNRQTA